MNNTKPLKNLILKTTLENVYCSKSPQLEVAVTGTIHLRLFPCLFWHWSKIFIYSEKKVFYPWNHYHKVGTGFSCYAILTLLHLMLYQLLPTDVTCNCTERFSFLVNMFVVGLVLKMIVFFALHLHVDCPARKFGEKAKT